jgi:large subunit ribosomal protein L33
MFASIVAYAKVKAAVVKLVSTAGTGFFYTTHKNPKKPKKLLLRKYDPVLRQHVLFKVMSNRLTIA